jgi:hypothetical protein
MKVTTTTQVSVDGVMQGHGDRHPEIEARRNAAKAAGRNYDLPIVVGTTSEGRGEE